MRYRCALHATALGDRARPSLSSGAHSPRSASTTPRYCDQSSHFTLASDTDDSRSALRPVSFAIFRNCCTSPSLA